MEITAHQNAITDVGASLCKRLGSRDKRAGCRESIVPYLSSYLSSYLSLSREKYRTSVVKEQELWGTNN